MTYKELLAYGEQRLSDAGIDDAKLDSWFLFQHLTKRDRTFYFLHLEEAVEKEIVLKFQILVERRAGRVPLSYITGSREFMGLHFLVNENVLIPEQDTEILVEAVLEFSEGKDILDLCTGSGCIALSIAILGKPKKVTASDISEKALEVAKKNLEALNTEEIADVEILKSDLFEKIQGDYDIIVSNPPYIRSEVIETLQPEVKEFEPRLALDGKEDGLAFYKRITKEAPRFLKKKGKLAYEIGYDQAMEVASLMRENGFRNLKVIRDYSGMDRVLIGEIE